MKNVIVTGGAKGIGATIVKELSKEGYNVILNYNKSEEEAKKIKEENNNIEIFKADVSKKEEVKKLINFAKEKFGTIDILINNAGIYKFNFIQDIEEEEWDEVINTNLKSVYLCIKEVAPIMIKNMYGCIINISSVDGMVGAACEAHYCASKAGIDGLTKALAKELGSCNIRVNSIAPGAIKTEMNKEVTQEDWKVVIEETPMKKIGTTIDIYNCVKWLIEDRFTTGQIISVNGGWVIT